MEVELSQPPPAAQPSYVPITTLVELPPPPRAALLLQQQHPTEEKKLYWDRSHYSSPAAQRAALTQSATLYVGNLNFSTRQVHLRNHFESLGRVERVILGLDRLKKTPCGFAFVQYAERRHALQSVRLLSGTKLDGKLIRVELDAGFQPGRQYGRGVSGGQVRDDRRRTPAQQDRKRSYEPPPAPTLDGALPSARRDTHGQEDMDTTDEPAAKRTRTL